MPVTIDPSGRRSVQAEVEVPGSPEEVWQAIATGAGVTAWFVPTAIEECVGGVVKATFGPGMDSLSQITAWQPPQRFTAESRDDMGPDDPTVATEWSVEARSGGTCVVRVVHSWFTNRADWDDQFEGHTFGWIAAFRILRSYLTHFPGQPCTPIQLMGVAPEPVSDAWAALTEPLGLAGASVGARVRTPNDAPLLAGVVESVGPPVFPELLIRLDEPSPGLAHLFSLPMGGQVYLPVRLYLYGDTVPPLVAKAQSLWQAWIDEHLGGAGGEGSAA